MALRNKSWLWLGAGVGAALATRALLRKRRAYDMRDKTVVITGGSRGLGLEMARLLAKEGARLALCARDVDELHRAAKELNELGAEVFILPCDITDEAEVKQIVRSVEERFGSIDVLINNAGVIEVGPMEEMKLEDYEAAIKTHFWAPLYMTLAALPKMRKRKQGRIVNISSIGGKLSVPHLLPYSASKFALVGLSEGLRSELIKDNIYVTTVCPGLMRTGSHVNASFKGQNKAEYTLFTIVGSSPLTSMDAEKAARQIITACKQGDAELVLSLPAKIGATVHALFPGLTAELLGVLNRALPEAGGIGKRAASGKKSHTALSPSILTALSDEAAVRNNEL